MPEAEVIIEGPEPRSYSEDFRIIPVPGHTAGSLCLLHRDRFLFTGDHLWWDQEARELASRSSWCGMQRPCTAQSSN